MRTMRSTTFLLACCLACCLASMASPASAQYKYVDANGRVTYSDVPPPPTARDVTTPKLGNATGPAPALPFELQQATSKYPVTLYAGTKCAPCEDARAYLRGRGVPFTERTVSSDDDIALFKQQSPDGTAPVIEVGSRRSVGFSQSTLSALLDDAGYPAANVLPRDWQNPAPTPLSPTTKAPAESVAPPSPQQARGPALPPSPPSPTAPPSNAPPGFRF